ncbi:MAG: hypothetical protein Q9192_005478 [Flavoplaca navasiana]
MPTGVDKTGALAGNLKQLLHRELRERQGQAFQPTTGSGVGTTCDDAFGPSYIDCNGFCYNPNDRESCCPGNGNAYPCPAQSFCLNADGICCPDGLDTAGCAAQNGVVLPAGGNTDTVPSTRARTLNPSSPSVLTSEQSTPNVVDTTSPTTNPTTSSPTSTVLDAAPTATIPAIPTNAAQEPVATGLSGASKAGIGIGAAVAAVIVGSLLYLLFRRRRKARQTSPINDDSVLEHFESDAMQPPVTESKQDDRPPDPPPTYPYDKPAPRINVGVSPDATSDALRVPRNNSQVPPADTEVSNMTIAGFYAPSSQHKESTQPPETLDFTSYHDRPEIDGSPIHEAPDSPRPYQGSVIGDVICNEPYSPPPKADWPGSVDVDHLSKLEQEERQLQEDIAQIERLERLKVERDRVRRRIRDLTEQPRRDST